MSDSLQPHEPQHSRPPCASPTPRVHPNSCPLIQQCHPTISSCPQPFPASESFQMSQLFISGGQSIGVSASTPVLPINTQDWSPLGWTGWISLKSKGLSESSPMPQFKSINSSAFSFLYSATLISNKTTGKNIALTIWNFVGKMMSLLFNTLSRFVIAFFPSCKHLLMSSTVLVCSDFGAQENKICHCFYFFPLYLAWSDGTGCHDLSLWNVEF